MKRSDIQILPKYYNQYIQLVDDIELNFALETCGINWMNENKQKLIQLGEQVYQEGKWTVKDIVQHLIDNERIFSFRAMSFARNDKTPLPGVDENYHAIEANANNRSIEDLISEYISTRQSVVYLFKSFSEEMLNRTGIANNINTSVLALGFLICGHSLHHFKVIEERYFPLLAYR